MTSCAFAGILNKCAWLNIHKFFHSFSYFCSIFLIVLCMVIFNKYLLKKYEHTCLVSQAINESLLYEDERCTNMFPSTSGCGATYLSPYSGDRGKQISANLRPSWSTYKDLSKPGIHSKILPQMFFFSFRNQKILVKYFDDTRTCTTIILQAYAHACT